MVWVLCRRTGAAVLGGGSLVPVALVVALLVVGSLGGGVARAQDGGGPDAGVLVIMDSSLSMEEPAGGGLSRMEAAKRAVSEVMAGLPQDAQVGLRVYGARVNESTRAEGCRDSELVAPVQAGAADRVDDAVAALEPKGRTPIGRSLREAPDDLEGFERKTVVLVSDGGDNCAPPDPCEAAREVAQQGVELTINVVGLQVTERVREQLRCIAEAGGGLYSDAEDPEGLLNELRAALARSFRSYEPSGRPVRGTPGPDGAPVLEEGAYLDSLGPGEAKWYRVEVERGQQLLAAAVAVIDAQTQTNGAFGIKIYPPGQDDGPFTQDALGLESVLGRIDARATRTGVIGLDPGYGEPGGYLIQVYNTADTGDVLPVEVLVEVTDANEPPDPATRQADKPDAGQGSPSQVPPGQSSADEASDGDGPSMLPLIAGGAGGVALVVGGTGGWLIARRREDR